MLTLSSVDLLSAVDAARARRTPTVVNGRVRGPSGLRYSATSAAATMPSGVQKAPSGKNVT